VEHNVHASLFDHEVEPLPFTYGDLVNVPLTAGDLVLKRESRPDGLRRLAPDGHRRHEHCDGPKFKKLPHIDPFISLVKELLYRPHPQRQESHLGDWDLRISFPIERLEQMSRYQFADLAATSSTANIGCRLPQQARRVRRLPRL
jgi:hypothetical protein